MTTTPDANSNLEFTCRPATEFEASSSGAADSGTESAPRRCGPPGDSESEQLRQDYDEMREKLLQQMAMADQIEITSRDRIAELEEQLKSEKQARQLVETARDELLHRLKVSSRRSEQKRSQTDAYGFILKEPFACSNLCVFVRRLSKALNFSA